MALFWDKEKTNPKFHMVSPKTTNRQSKSWETKAELGPSHFFHFKIYNKTTGKGQFSFQSQRKAMAKNVKTTTQLHSSHMLAK